MKAVVFDYYGTLTDPAALEVLPALLPLLEIVASLGAEQGG